MIRLHRLRLSYTGTPEAIRAATVRLTRCWCLPLPNHSRRKSARSLCDHMDIWTGHQLPAVVGGVVMRVDEHTPVGIVQRWEIGAVVIARPAGLLAEEHVPHMRLPYPAAVPQLPAAQEFMLVPRCQVSQVSPQRLDEFDTPLQRRPIRRIPG